MSLCMTQNELKKKYNAVSSLYSILGSKLLWDYKRKYRQDLWKELALLKLTYFCSTIWDNHTSVATWEKLVCSEWPFTLSGRWMWWVPVCERKEGWFCIVCKGCRMDPQEGETVRIYPRTKARGSIYIMEKIGVACHRQSLHAARTLPGWQHTTRFWGKVMENSAVLVYELFWVSWGRMGQTTQRSGIAVVFLCKKMRLVCFLGRVNWLQTSVSL